MILQYPCPKELPPWFLERRNISRKHPGRGHSGKLVCLAFIVIESNLHNYLLCTIAQYDLHYDILTPDF